MEYYNNDEILEFLNEYYNGDIDARNKIVLNYYNMVVSIARKYICPYEELEVLIQEGCLALIEAIDTFDNIKDCKFSTYAYLKIKYAILNALNRNNHIVKIPMKAMDEKSLLERTIHKYYMCNYTLPSEEELHEMTGIELSKIKNLLNIINRVSLTTAMLEMTDEKDTVEEAYSFEDKMLDKEYDEFVVKDLLSNSGLTEKQKLVILNTFGINCERKNNIELASVLGISKQAVNETYKNGIMKMKRYARINEY